MGNTRPDCAVAPGRSDNTRPGRWTQTSGAGPGQGAAGPGQGGHDTDE